VVLRLDWNGGGRRGAHEKRRAAQTPPLPSLEPTKAPFLLLVLLLSITFFLARSFRGHSIPDHILNTTTTSITIPNNNMPPAALQNHSKHVRGGARRPAAAAAPRRAAAAAASSRRPASAVRALTLYGNPGSRSRVCEWYAREIGLTEQQLRVKNLDMRGKQEHKSADYVKKIHPFGQVPALVDDATGFAMFESGAILQYLAEKHGGLDNPEKRAKAASWIAWANTSFGQALFFDGPRERALPGLLQTLDEILGGQPYIAGSEFSVADIAVGSYLSWIPRFFSKEQVDISPYKNVVAYAERVLSRPAAKATIMA
jgi:glutathione S-transferase